MNNMWNNTCVLISSNGDVFLSDPTVRGHNGAINNCASKIGLNISTEQSMPLMCQTLTHDHHTVLLNAGKVLDDYNVEKRTGYLALPNSFSLESLEQIENLKLLLEEEYQAVTVWKLENNSLKTKSFGDVKEAIFIIQNMLNEIANRNVDNMKK